MNDIKVIERAPQESRTMAREKQTMDAGCFYSFVGAIVYKRAAKADAPAIESMAAFNCRKGGRVPSHRVGNMQNS